MRFLVFAAVLLASCAVRGPAENGASPVNAFSVCTPVDGGYEVSCTPIAQTSLNSKHVAVSIKPSDCVEIIANTVADGGTFTAAVGQRYRFKAETDLCLKEGAYPSSCAAGTAENGKIRIAVDQPEEFAFEAAPDGGAPTLYVLAKSSNGALNICKLNPSAP